MLQYSQDYDEKLPPARRSDVDNRAVLPEPGHFQQPGDGLARVHLSAYGQNQAAMASPATIPMGYLAGPGGRAVVWQTDT